jgi:hypothetical protein
MRIVHNGATTSATERRASTSLFAQALAPVASGRARLAVDQAVGQQRRRSKVIDHAVMTAA